MNNDNQPGDTGHDSGGIEAETSTDTSHGPDTGRRTFMKGLGAAGAASVAGTGTVAAQDNTTEDSGIIDKTIDQITDFDENAEILRNNPAIGVTPVGGVVAATAGGFWGSVFGSSASTEDMTEATQEATKAAYQVSLGSEWAEIHSDILNVRQRLGSPAYGTPGENETLPDVTGTQAQDMIRSEAMYIISEGLKNGLSAAQIKENIRANGVNGGKSHEEIMADFQEKLISKFNLHAFQQWEAVHTLWQRVTQLDNDSLSNYTTLDVSFDTSDSGIGTFNSPNVEATGDNGPVISDIMPTLDIELVDGRTVTTAPALIWHRAGLVTANDDVEAVLPVYNSNEHAVGESRYLTYPADDAKNSVIGDVEKVFSGIQGGLVPYGGETRWGAETFFQVDMSGLSDDLDLSRVSNADDAAVSLKHVMDIQAHFNRLLESESVAMESYVDKIWTAHDEGRIDPGDLLSPSQISNQSSDQFTRNTTDYLYLGMDGNLKNTVEYQITRADGSTRSGSGFLMMSFPGKPVSRVDTIQSNDAIFGDSAASDVVRGIRNADGGTSTEKEVIVDLWIEYEDASGNAGQTKTVTDYSILADQTSEAGFTIDMSNHVDTSNVNQFTDASMKVKKVGQGHTFQRRVHTGDTVKVNNQYSLGDAFNTSNVASVANTGRIMKAENGEMKEVGIRNGDTINIGQINTQDGNGTLDYLTFSSQVPNAANPEEDYPTRVDEQSDDEDKATTIIEKTETTVNIPGFEGVGEAVNQITQLMKTMVLVMGGGVGLAVVASIASALSSDD